MRRIGVAVAMMVTPTAFAQECLKLSLEGGPDCGQIKVKADLSACGDELLGAPKIKCQGDSAVLRFRGNLNTYRVEIKKQAGGDGAWGAQPTWEMTGIKRTNTKNLTSQKALDKSAKQGAVSADRVDPEGAVKPAIAASSEKTVPGALQFSAYIDLYMSHNFNRPNMVTPLSGGGTPQQAQIPNAQNNLRFYDWYNDRLGLNLVELTVKYTRKETALLIDFDFGQFADINAQVPATVPSGVGGPTSSVVDDVSKHIGQAVFTYTPVSAPNLIVEFGKLPTHVGLELMKAKDNWNYTRGALFSFGGPFWHTGAHVGYAVAPGQWMVSGYVYNGWNTIYDTNSQVTYGAQLKYTPSDKLTWIYNYIGGPEQSENNADWKQVHESNLVWAVNDKLSLAFDGLYGMEQVSTIGDAKWAGAMVGARWNYAQGLAVAPRVEYYRDMHGWTLGGVSQTLNTYTLTQSVQMSDGFEVRLEGRIDKSDQNNRFVGRNGKQAPSQATIAAAILYTL